MYENWLTWLQRLGSSKIYRVRCPLGTWAVEADDVRSSLGLRPENRRADDIVLVPRPVALRHRKSSCFSSSPTARRDLMS